MMNYCLVAFALSFVACVLVVGASMFSSGLSREEDEAEQVAANVRRTEREYADELPVLPIEARCRVGRVMREGR